MSEFIWKPTVVIFCPHPPHPTLGDKDMTSRHWHVSNHFLCRGIFSPLANSSDFFKGKISRASGIIMQESEAVEIQLAGRWWQKMFLSIINKYFAVVLTSKEDKAANASESIRSRWASWHVSLNNFIKGRNDGLAKNPVVSLQSAWNYSKGSVE